jgi:hypothetical protein
VEEPLETTLVDAISFLSQHQVPYVLIGGIAASLQGETRVTADVDLVIGAEVERALDLVRSLDKSVFVPLFAGVEDVVKRAFILPLRHLSTGIKVDLALGLSGFEQQILTRAQTIEVGSHQIRIATGEDLLVMKLLAGRPRDLQDAEGIAIVQGDRFDWTYCLETAHLLGQAIDQDIASQVAKLRSTYGA